MIRAPKRTRRGGRNHRRGVVSCTREGCGRPVLVDGNSFCSHLCRLVTQEQVRTHRVCSVVGACPATSELSTSAAELAAALGRYFTAEDKVYKAAQSVGITFEQWRAIRDGLVPA